MRIYLKLIKLYRHFAVKITIYLKQVKLCKKKLIQTFK